MFILLKGEVEVKGNDHEQGLKTLEQLFKIKGIKIGQDLPRIDGMFQFTNEVTFFVLISAPLPSLFEYGSRAGQE